MKETIESSGSGGVSPGTIRSSPVIAISEVPGSTPTPTPPPPSPLSSSSVSDDNSRSSSRATEHSEEDNNARHSPLIQSHRHHHHHHQSGNDIDSPHFSSFASLQLRTTPRSSQEPEPESRHHQEQQEEDEAHQVISIDDDDINVKYEDNYKNNDQKANTVREHPHDEVKKVETEQIQRNMDMAQGDNSPSSFPPAPPPPSPLNDDDDGSSSSISRNLNHHRQHINTKNNLNNSSAERHSMRGRKQGWTNHGFVPIAETEEESGGLTISITKNESDGGNETFNNSTGGGGGGKNTYGTFVGVINNLNKTDQDKEKKNGGRFAFSMRQTFVAEKDRRNILKDIRSRFSKETDSEKFREDSFVKITRTTDLLAKLFALFDFNQDQKLVQDEWIEFLKARLNREEKQVDFVEVVESVTYALCGDSDVTFAEFCSIFRTKNVLNKLYRLIDKDLDGIVTADQVMEFISQLSSARSSSRLTKENIKWLEKLFRQYVGDGNEIRKQDFNKIIQTKNQFFTERVFEIFDKDSSGSISLQEFLDCMHQFTGQNPDDKIHFLFKVYDVDGDGLIQEAELEQVMRACMEENGMKFSDEQIHELTMALFEDADVERRGALTYEALKAQLEKHGGLLENLSISIERWLVPPKPREEDVSLIGKLRAWKPHQFSYRYFRNNYVYLIWLTAFLITNAALFFYRIFCWRLNKDGKVDSSSFCPVDSHIDYIVVARAAGQCLNFNCTFIVVVMLRQTLTFLRARGASSYLPIDQHIYFHKMTGWFIFFFSFIHTIMHLVNIKEGLMAKVEYANTTYLAILFDPMTTELGLIHGYGFNTGFVLMIILTVMVICSLPFVRRGGCFEVFYWTHLLYFAFWTLLIIHAPNYWKWFIGPGVLFVIEQGLRYYHWRVGRGRTYISSGILLPSKVTHLAIRRPPNFEFRPGDYVFVRIPDIAKYEWHPFTISSAPEQEDVVSLHIRAVGQWTNRLYDYFEHEQSKLLSGNGEEMCLRPRLQTFSSGLTPTKKVFISPSEGSAVSGINSEPPRDIHVRRVAFEETRNRLKSVDDSVTTMIPSSSSSESPSASVQDFSSSVETVSESEAMIKDNKKIAGRLHKQKLEYTKSLPNVHDRDIELQKKHTLGQIPAVQRSLSVQSVESDKANGGTAIHTRSNQKTARDPTVADSLRYMRIKPKIISLKTPTFDGKDENAADQMRGSGNTCSEKLAEEGESSFLGGGSSALVSPDNNSQLPRQWSSFQVTGTTITSDEDMAVGKPLEIFVDGPYGAPSSHIFRAQHAVLIATGIGVTPFASILQSIMLRYWQSRITCPQCEYVWCGDMPQSVFNLKKVDFLWINREQRSFEWFVHLLSQLEIEQALLGGAMERFLDMHMYITSALQRTDMKAVGLQLALDLLHEKEKRDLITGLKTRTNAGRPNWNKLFKQLQDQNKGKITVFYCGPPTLARTLKMKCDEFGFTFRKELF